MDRGRWTGLGFSDTQRGEGDRGRWTGLGVSDTQRGEGIGGDGQAWVQ